MKGFTQFSVFLKRVSLVNPQVRTNFVAFPLERTTGKSLEVQFDFGPRPGFSKQLFGSSREGTELDWTCFKLGRTPRGSCNRTLLRRVLRRFFKGSAS